MTPTLVVAGSLAVAVWTYLLVGRGGFWRIRRQLVQTTAATVGDIATTQSQASDISPIMVAAIVPARNEAEVVAISIRSLVSLRDFNQIHVFLVDDASTDGTADIARCAAVTAGKAQTVTVIQGQPLPAGWSGKLWAVRQGINAARPLQCRYLLLTDADVVLAKDEVSALIAVAESGGYDLASLMVKLRCRTFAEKLLIPAFVFFFFKLYPPRWAAAGTHATAGAAGGCMLIRPEALERAGGVEAIRGEVIDDCSLAQAVKRSGGRVWLGLANESASIRVYGSFGGIGRMISRTAFNQLRHSKLLLLGAFLGLVMTYVLPIAILFTGRMVPAMLGLVAWLMMTLAYLPMVRYYRLNPAWAMSLPLVALFYAGATVHSAVKYWFGHGGEWKGRVQDPA